MHDLKKTRTQIIQISVVMIAMMFVVDAIIQPAFYVKSMIKIVLFLVIPFIYINKTRGFEFTKFFRVESRKQLWFSLGLGVIIYGVIMIAYFIFERQLDLGEIRVILGENLKVNDQNFIWVALYIALFNSLLEEYFFRGFLFLGLKNVGFGIASSVLSAFLFAIYHVAIIGTWFEIGLFVLVMLGLFIGGLIFNALNDRNGNIYNSWFVHMFANFAINTVGLIMFGYV